MGDIPHLWTLPSDIKFVSSGVMQRGWGSELFENANGIGTMCIVAETYIHASF